MKNELQLTVEELATLLWIQKLDEFNDGVNISLRDKYYNFIENNSAVDDIEISEFDSIKDKLVSYDLLRETDERLEFTKAGRDVVEKVYSTEKKVDEADCDSKKGLIELYKKIKRFINDNSSVLQVTLAATSIILSAVEVLC